MRIVHARVVTPHGLCEDHTVELNGSTIAAVGPDTGAQTAADVDATGCTLVPGFLDMHFHGCLGRDLMDMGPAHWQSASTFLARHGVTGFLATYTTSPSDLTTRFLAFAQAQAPTLQGAELLGVHLEGPYLNPQYAGMMPEAYLRAPDAHEYEPWLASGFVRRLTAALELPGAERLMADCHAAGTLFSLGHTVCAAADVSRWADQGLRHVTHLYNAMSRAEKRGPVRWSGCLEGVLIEPRVFAEIIGDGFHVPEPLFRIAAQCKSAARLTVASDATPFTGAVQEGVPIRYGGETGQELIVRNNMALSIDEQHLVGSICPLGEMFARISAWLGDDVPGTAAAFATHPADLMGLGQRKGRIAPGYDADLALLDADLRVRATWVAGQQVYSASAVA